RLNSGGPLVKTDTSLAAGSFSLHGAALQPDTNGPKILVADTEQPPGSPTFVPALYRFNPDGQLDDTFGLHGRIQLNLGPTGLLAFAEAVAVRPSDNSIFVVGHNLRSSLISEFELAVEHLNANGTVDLGFGQNGVVHQDFGLFDFNVTGLELALQPHGQLV